MSVPEKIPLSRLSRGDLESLTERLLAENAALKQAMAELRAEIAKLKGVTGCPVIRPSGMEQKTEPTDKAGKRGVKQRKTERLVIHEDRVIQADVPAGSRFKGYEDFVVQDLVLRPHVVRLRRERWLTPNGRTVLAPMPAGVAGHFGPGVVRFILMQHFQGQVTAERLLTQLRAMGVRISKGQIIALLNQNNTAFHNEKDAVLEAGLETARWLTVDDTGARHARTNQYTTHIGDDRFAYFATRPNKSRLNFLELLRAGRGDYVINAAAEAWMVEHGVPEPVIAAVVGHERHSFADEAVWEAHLAGLGVADSQWRTVTEAAVIGALEERSLLQDTVIVSDNAGQFDVFTHALCWVHAERHLRKLVCVTDEQRRLVEAQRCLVWWYYADLKAYQAEPTPERRSALRQRFDRVFGRVTGFAALDVTVARIRATKADLLVVLDRPEIPLHTNGSERDIRCCVTKRKISGETRADAGKQARDTFLSLLKTCSKLAASFWDYLGARLKIPDANAVPWLPDLVRQRAIA